MCKSTRELKNRVNEQFKGQSFLQKCPYRQLIHTHTKNLLTENKKRVPPIFFLPLEL